MITRQTTIGDIVDKYPQVVETLLSYGVHCVGCHVSPYESLEEGFRGHGLPEEDIDGALEKMNRIVADNPVEVVAKPNENSENMSNQNNINNDNTIENTSEELILTMSDLAAAKIKAFCEDKGKQALRVAVERGGCSGKKYLFDLENEPKENDIRIERAGATIFIDEESLQTLNGSEIDYNDGLTGAGFIVNNPNANSMCGCGKSFN